MRNETKLFVLWAIICALAAAVEHNGHPEHFGAWVIASAIFWHASTQREEKR